MSLPTMSMGKSRHKIEVVYSGKSTEFPRKRFQNKSGLFGSDYRTSYVWPNVVFFGFSTTYS